MLSRSRKRTITFISTMFVVGTAAAAKMFTWALTDPPFDLPVLRAAQVATYELGQTRKPVKNDQVLATFAGVNNPAGLYVKVSSLSSIRYHELAFAECGGGDGGAIN